MTTTIDQGVSPETAAVLGLDIRPMAGHIGAEILGVDLTAPLAPEVVGAIRSTLLRWKVVFFREQDITQEQHIAFGRLFGEVTPAHPTLPAVFPEHPEILLLDNEQFGLKDGVPEGTLIESRWHTDVTFVANPPMGSILRGVIVPEYGGDTQWINLIAAYTYLSEPIRTMIDGLHAIHHNVLPERSGKGMSNLKSTFQSKEIQSVHPVVRVHPETGEKSLFVNPNFTSHIVELTRQEGRHLLAMLYEHMSNPVFSVRLRWQPGTMAFWDNRCTAHIVPTDIPRGMRRSMQRITIAGDVPVGPDGSKSEQLVGDSF
jgi:taurine dioxygenase